MVRPGNRPATIAAPDRSESMTLIRTALTLAFLLAIASFREGEAPKKA